MKASALDPIVTAHVRRGPGGLPLELHASGLADRDEIYNLVRRLEAAHRVWFLTPILREGAFQPTVVYPLRLAEVQPTHAIRLDAPGSPWDEASWLLSLNDQGNAMTLGSVTRLYHAPWQPTPGGWRYLGCVTPYQANGVVTIESVPPISQRF